jgi:chemotaxis protein methyltransferase CheR
VSIAVLLEEIRASGLLPYKYSILATDIDQSVLQRAREGIFTEKEVEQVPADWLKKYFHRISKPEADWAKKMSVSVCYEALHVIMDHINPRFHNLLDPKWESGFDLIVCRNVLIYFNREIIETLVGRFSEALLPGGLLFIGGTELIFSLGKVGLTPVATGFYMKQS